jgi:hypothetical protein
MGKNNDQGSAEQQQAERDRVARLERTAAETGKSLDEVADLDTAMRQTDR